MAPSLGGVETLITLTALTSHAGLTPEERAEVGVADGLIRVSVGIEGTDDPVVDGAIGGAVFAWLYNRLLGKREA